MRRLLYVRPLAHFTIDSVSGVSCRALEKGRGEKKGERKKKRKKKKQQIDTIPAVESLLFEGVSVSRANEIQEI